MGMVLDIMVLVYGGSLVTAVGCGIAGRYSPAVKRHLIGDVPPP